MSRAATNIIIRRENGEVVSQYALGTGEHPIGRESDCDIYIEDKCVSWHQARLIICAKHEVRRPKGKVCAVEPWQGKQPVFKRLK